MSNAAVAARFASQHGVITTKQAREAGLTRHEIDGLIRRGAWVKVHQGVYRLAGAAWTARGEIMAAVLAAGEGAVASHSTAAWLLGARRLVGEDPPPNVIEVCREDTTPRRVGNVIVHRTVDLATVDRVEVGNIPSTSGARTLVDSAGCRDRHTLTAGLDEMIGQRQTSRHGVYLRARALRRGRAGVGNLIMLTGPGAEGSFRSWLERQGAHAFRAGKLPAPQWNVPVSDASGFIGIVDALFEGVQPVEIDGPRFHTQPGDWQRDVTKANRMALHFGRPVLRYTWEDVVHRPDYVVAQIRSALAAQGRLSQKSA